jgi:hypothetical protein
MRQRELKDREAFDVVDAPVLQNARGSLLNGENEMSAPIVDISVHHDPNGMSDRIAYGFTKALRFCADTFFAKATVIGRSCSKPSRRFREWSGRRSIT